MFCYMHVTTRIVLYCIELNWIDYLPILLMIKELHAATVDVVD